MLKYCSTRSAKWTKKAPKKMPTAIGRQAYSPELPNSPEFSTISMAGARSDLYFTKLTCITLRSLYGTLIT